MKTHSVADMDATLLYGIDHKWRMCGTQCDRVHMIYKHCSGHFANVTKPNAKDGKYFCRIQCSQIEKWYALLECTAKAH